MESGWVRSIKRRGERHRTLARKAHPGFPVDGLATLVEALKRAGHRVVEDEPLEGYDRVYVDDPFGDRQELIAVQDRPAPAADSE